ncbi:MAG: sodium-dependent bicarbonate transport family permease, partial [Thiocapsa sp. C3-sup]|uniref:sodium-dependent bicarbonate transport family permease n=1 Tax=Thiocapsa sp. C3-sup TaxID=3137396 RepID=UPI0035B2E855
MSALSNLLIPAVLFFALGFIARLVKSDLRFPPDLAKILSIYLLVSIGLHGGVELAKADLGEAIAAVVWALALGFLLPLIGFGLLLATRRVAPLDAAAIAAHYGSVSAGTFLTAIAFLGSQGVDYERYPLIMLAIMESPAIVVGILLASWTRRRIAAANPGGSTARSDSGNGGSHLGDLLREAFTNGSVVLLLGSMLIGAIANPTAMKSLDPFTTDIFMGMLCLFLLEMGLEAGRRFGDFRRVGLALGAFGLVMPLIGGAIG